MGHPLAVLPMYDWLAVRSATDAWWSCLRDAMCEAGFDAPERLERSLSPMEAWRSPDLLFGQTCGLPFVTGLQDCCEIVGTPAFAPAEGDPPLPAGTYDSAVVVRADDPRNELASFRGATAAVNGTNSLSGSMALLELVGGQMGHGRFFDTVVTAGSHAASIARVADGRADIAAIDRTTWRLARRHLPAASKLRVLTRTVPAPALPYITAKGHDVKGLANAVDAALAELGHEARSALGLAGFVHTTAADYADLARRHDGTRAIAAAHGLKRIDRA